MVSEMLVLGGCVTAFAPGELRFLLGLGVFSGAIWLLVSGRVGVSNKKDVCMDKYTNAAKIELMEGSP